MIVHIATRRGITSLRNVKRRGQALGADVLALRYDDLPGRTEWPRGLYLFSDMQRATPWQRAVATQLWDRLSERSDAFRLYNHPEHSLRRHQLLRALYEAGVNKFNAFRLDELPTSLRFPVFIRYEDQHIGPSTGLLNAEEELERALSEMLVAGHRPEKLIVAEFQDTACETRIFRKYGAFRLGDRVYTGHMMASTDWSVKREINDRVLVGTEDFEFVKTNPHADQVMEAFKVAGLTWGRIDYGVLDGRIQVWEINDNPKLGSSFFKKTMGRKLARRVSRRIRLSVFREQLDKVVMGPAVALRLDPGELSQRIVTGQIDLDNAVANVPLRLES
jgi:hypothetical protein